jgi:hypothetical protein
MDEQLTPIEYAITEIILLQASNDRCSIGSRFLACTLSIDPD